MYGFLESSTVHEQTAVVLLPSQATSRAQLASVLSNIKADSPHRFPCTEGMGRKKYLELHITIQSFHGRASRGCKTPL